MNNKSNILLIGMPGAGKSTVGKIISKKTGMALIDTDDLIENREGLELQRIIDIKGPAYFSAREEELLLELTPENSIISPGGSAVYYPAAMEHLRSICTVVYLKCDISTLLGNIKNFETRGIVFGPGQTFQDIYDERCPLYEKYADMIIDAGRPKPGDVAYEIMGILKLPRK